MTPADTRDERPGRNMRRMIWGIILIGGSAPLVLYWLAYGRLATVTPPQAKELLRRPGDAALLVDVRPAAEFQARHIDGAKSWPLDQILVLRQPGDVPRQFRGKTLLLVCNVGVSSTRAAWHLTGRGVERVVNVRGGAQDWIGSAPGPKGDRFDRWRTASGETVEFPFRRSPWHEQAAAVVSGFAVKPAYTLLSLLLALALWRSKAADLVALRWAMVFFFIGEDFCALNYVLFRETSYLFEYLHSFGMLLCFGFTTYAFLEGFDRRILMLSEPDRKCAALGLCRGCVKYSDAPCGLKRTFFLIVPACIVLALMPLVADPHALSYNTWVFDTFYNYSHPAIHQQYEFFYCPIVAILLLIASLLVLTFKKENPIGPAKVLFAAAMGPLGFALLRLVINGPYSQNLVWRNWWEEATELLFIVGVGFVLWTFRQGLFPAGKDE